MSTDGTSSKVDQSAQPAGMATHDQRPKGGQSSQDFALFDRYNRLCELVPKAAERAALLGVPETVDLAWTTGKMMPVLRSRQKAIETAITRLEHEQS